jgi:hypothetical protein
MWACGGTVYTVSLSLTPLTGLQVRILSCPPVKFSCERGEVVITPPCQGEVASSILVVHAKYVI